MREKIIKVFLEVLIQTDCSLRVSTLQDDTILLESGMDSLGFGILVAQLEDQFGFDPFVLMESAVYPKTFGEFVSIYEKFNPNK